MSKPDSKTAMLLLIERIRELIPFDVPEAVTCSDKNSCEGCSVKLMQYLELELDSWEQKLNEGYVPDFKDLSKLEKTARKIYQTLERNALV